MEFVHLNCHSNYSLLSGANSIEDLVTGAKKQGSRAIALTDTNGAYGALYFAKACKKHNLKPIFGAAIEHNGEQAVLLAKNLSGYGELCRIITDKHLKNDFSLTKRLKEASDGVFIFCGNIVMLEELVKSRGRKNLIVELQNFKNKKTRLKIKELYAFSKKACLPTAATNNVHFVEPQGYKIHKVLSAIRTNTTLDTLAAASKTHREAWLKPAIEMKRLFAEIPRAIGNTQRIAEACNVTFETGPPRFPEFNLPAGETPFSYLWKLAFDGTRRLYRPITGQVIERLQYELNTIDKLGYSPYFLIVWDIAREAEKRGIPTMGRGSAANSIICYTLKITAVDPIKHNLYFERFLNPERKDCPDIDLDFPWNRRDEIIEYVYKKYGRDKVAMISTHVHFHGRSIVREVGKALGIPASEIDTFASRLPHFSELAKLNKTKNEFPESRDLPVESEPYKTILRIGRNIEGFPRHLSIHCGGIIVSPCPITDLVPLQRSSKGIVITQYDMYPVEDMGLVKIDLLGQRALAVIVDAVKAIKEHYGVDINFEKLDPAGDEKTCKIIREGKTTGCFYIESPGMRALLKKLNVDDFETLVAASSIIRPGVSDSGMMKTFIDRRLGKEKTVYLHPALKKTLKDTYGVMIYQEDVIKVANVIAGMGLGDADSLRKCMSKKRNWETMSNYKERFISGAIRNKVKKNVAEEIWRQIESFGGYAFCKAHSASFAIISYQTAYLKAHYSAEFMAAVLSNQGGFYNTAEYVEESRRMGLTIRGPDINQSKDNFTAEKNGGEKYNAIRLGFMQIKGLSRSAIDSILENRKKGNYTSLQLFLKRVEIGYKETQMLIKCGVFDCFHPSRPGLLWELESLIDKKRIMSKKNYLFDELSLIVEEKKEPYFVPGTSNYSLEEKIRIEQECLDTAVSAHPMTLYKNKKDAAGIVPGISIANYPNKMVQVMGILVTCKRTRTLKKEYMEFLTLEDETTSFEVVLFPKIYQRFGHLITDQGPYIVRGKVEKEGSGTTITAHWLGRV